MITESSVARLMSMDLSGHQKMWNKGTPVLGRGNLYCLVFGIVNEYLSSSMKCLHQKRESVCLCCLAMDIVNEYPSSSMKCLHQMGECMFVLPGYGHS